MATPELTLHVLPPSHPCMATEKALRLKGLDYERVALSPGPHVEAMAEVYGEGKTTVPGMVIDGEPVHGSSAIYARLEALAPEPALFPEPIADKVRDAERWGDEELQPLGRHLTWGAMHFRPEAMGTFGGGEPLDPAGVDFAIKYLRPTWKYHNLTAQLIASDLEGLPAKLDHVDQLAADGVIGGDEPNAADLQIGSTLRVLQCVGDLAELMDGRPGTELARRWFPEYAGHIPAGAFPAGWVPSV